MRILFINGSPNHHGHTAGLAAALLHGKAYETLNLTDYTIGAYGQQLPGDGLDNVITAMKKADTIVIGSPVYWHNICGMSSTASMGRSKPASCPGAGCISCSKALRRKNGCWTRANTPCSALPGCTA